MPDTPIYGFPFESPLDQPGISLTGGSSGTEDILAEVVEQVLQSITASVGAAVPVVRVYESSDTWNKPDNLLFGWVRAQGPGGGGGGAQATGSGEGSAGNGGTSGVYAERIIPAASLSSSETVTVGTGGSGGVGNSQGDNGSGATSFGTLVSGDPGVGGGARAAASVAGTEPLDIPPTAGTGDLVIPGRSGEPCGIFDPSSGARVTGGTGGSSPLGSGGLGQRADSSPGGIDGAGYGSGGGGHANGPSSTVETGGDGADGVVIVIEYYAVIL